MLVGCSLVGLSIDLWVGWLVVSWVVELWVGCQPVDWLVGLCDEFWVACMTCADWFVRFGWLVC